MTIYWLDCVSGNDTGAGTEGSPWLTPAPLKALNGGLGPASGSILMGRGRCVAANDGSSYTSLAMILNSGTPDAKTTVRGYDPAYPFEWWCAGKMVNRTGTLRNDAAGDWTRPNAGTYPDTWEVTLTQAWAGQRWCFYWNGNQGRAAADQPIQLKPVDSPALVFTTPNSFFVDTTSAPVLRVNVAGLGATSPSGRILHGKRGHALRGVRGAESLFTDLQHVMLADFHYYACGHRLWGLNGKALAETGCSNIEIRRGGIHFCDTNEDHSPIRPLGRAGPCTIDRSVLEGGDWGIIYPTNNVAGLGGFLGGGEGHCMTGWYVTRNVLQQAGFHDEGDGHGQGFLGSGKRHFSSGNLYKDLVRPVVVWVCPSRTIPYGQHDLVFRRENVASPHDSGAVDEQVRTAAIGNIETVAGDTEMKVTVNASVVVGAGFPVTIDDAGTVGGINLATGSTNNDNEYTVTRRVSATQFWVRTNAAAAASATSAEAHAVTLAARGPSTVQAFGVEGGQNVGQDMSGIVVDGCVIDPPRFIPPTFSESSPGVPLFSPATRFRGGNAPYNAHAIRMASLYDTPEVRYCVVRHWPLGAWSTNADPKRKRFRRNVVIGPRKMGAPDYGFVSAHRSAASYPDFDFDRNLYITEASPPDGEVPQWLITGSAVFAGLGAWQAQDFPHLSGGGYQDLNSVLVVLTENTITADDGATPLTADDGATALTLA